LSDVYRSDVPYRTIDEQARDNVRDFRALRAFTLALKKGLTDAQYEHLFAVLGENLITADRALEIANKVEEFKASLPGRTTRAVAEQRLAEFQAQFTESEIQYLLRVNLSYSKEKAVATVSSLPESADTFIKDVIEVARSLGNTKSAEAVVKTVQKISDPKVAKQLKLVDLLSRDEISIEQIARLVEPFQENTPEEAALIDIVNSHPVAERLWGDRMAWLSTHENVYYKKHYEEGDESGVYTEASEGVKDHRAKRVEKFLHSDAAEAPVMAYYPFSCAFAEITHWKLQALAIRFLGFDLDSDLGATQFESFCHNYDISPGESTLDRLHRYPPDLHTYEELPIIKFDGWDEADVPEDYPEYLEEQQRELKQHSRGGPAAHDKTAHGHH